MTRAFRIAYTITDDDGAVLSEESTGFNPHATDEHGYNETAHMLLERLMAASKYDAEQLDLEAEQGTAENIAADKADHDYKLAREDA